MEFLETYYHATKQELVKQRHLYANDLARGYMNRYNATININANGQNFKVKSNWPAKWLDGFFQRIIDGKPRLKIEKEILKIFRRDVRLQ